MIKKIFVSVSQFDLKKKWYIYTISDTLERKKYIGDINRAKTIDERVERIKIIVAALEKEHGVKCDWSPGNVSNYSSENIYNYLKDNRRRWRRKTYQTYKSKFDVFFKWLGDNKLCAEAVRKFFEHLLEKGRSKTTYAAYRLTFETIFSKIDYMKLIEGVESLRSRKESFRFFSEPEARKIMTEFERVDAQLYRFCQLVMYCYIRPGEIRQLKVRDIDFSSGKIIISGAVAKNETQQYASIPKGLQHKVKEWWGSEPGENYLFRKPGANKPVTEKFYPMRHQSIISQMGFDCEKYKLYSWKHTGAVMFVKNGGKLKHLQLLMRHSSLEQTDTYLSKLGVGDFEDEPDVMPIM